MFNRIPAENNSLFASLDALASQGENIHQQIQYETSEAVCELSFRITQKSINGPCKPLTDRILAEHGSYEAAQPILQQMHLLIKLESRTGNLRQRYPNLEVHEIVELIYEQIKTLTWQSNVRRIFINRLQIELSQNRVALKRLMRS